MGRAKGSNHRPTQLQHLSHVCNIRVHIARFCRNKRIPYCEKNTSSFLQLSDNARKRNNGVEQWDQISLKAPRFLPIACTHFSEQGFPLNWSEEDGGDVGIMNHTTFRPSTCYNLGRMKHQGLKMPLRCSPCLRHRCCCSYLCCHFPAKKDCVWLRHTAYFLDCNSRNNFETYL